MRRLLISALLVAGLGLLSAGRAKADELFTYTFGGNTFTWQLPESPTIPPSDFVTGVLFDISNVPFSENGVPQGTGFFDFYNSSQGGGFDLLVGTTVILNEFGTQLYTGPESAPTFLFGTPITLNNGSPDGPAGTLTTSSAVPEPGSLLLLGTGLLGFIGFARKKIFA